MTARQRDWGIMFCWQNLTLGYKMLWLARYALTNTLTAQKPPCSQVWAQLLSLRHVAVRHHPTLPLVLINLYMLTCQSSSGNLKRWAGIKTVEIWGLTLAPPTSCPTTECPKNGVWIWIEMEERQAEELKVHTNRLRKRKSKCSENKPHKLLQPLGNLLKAHKTRFCYNTWSYNGDPFQIPFFCRAFFSPLVSTGHGKLMRDWQHQVLQCRVLKASLQPD